MNDNSQKFLSEAECRAVFDRIVALAGNVEIDVGIDSWWTGSVKWARNRAYLSKDVSDIRLKMMLRDRGRTVVVGTDRIDEPGLREAVDTAKRGLYYSSDVDYQTWVEPQLSIPMLNPTLWSEATVAFNATRRGEIARQLIDAAEDAKLLTAGDLLITSQCRSFQNNQGIARYFPSTRAQFSATVRDPKGNGSGWAGTDDFDITRIDMKALGHRALDKCQRSLNPVAIEPGRYTTILEPQAVADLWTPVMGLPLMRPESEDPMMNLPFYRSPGRSKIGERVIDSRIVVGADPMHHIGGFAPFELENGMPYLPTAWIDKGVVRQLSYNRFYALDILGLERPLPNSFSWYMSGGTTPVDEMIATTKRGVLVTRLHGVQVADMHSLTCTGYTRDGVWLIENGKISYPVKNFRFTESPLFVLNKLEQLGVPQRVFSDSRHMAWVAPPLKVNDFNFTQLSYAV